MEAVSVECYSTVIAACLVPQLFSVNDLLNCFVQDFQFLEM
jgi:hypothetical protein